MQLLHNDKPFSGDMVEKLRRLRSSAPGTTFSPVTEGDFGKLNTIGLVKGAIIGGVYEIIEEIGRGGMGEVYLVRHTALGKKCALKVVPPDKVDELGWMRFQNEARYIAQLSHINLVRVTDLGIHEGCLPFYAMDLVQGKTLADYLAANGKLGWPNALDIFIQACDGLAYAHKHGIIHRDLKPANIMVADLDKAKISVKILDFGLAKLTDDRAKQSLTAVGEVFGSPFYMSPEQCEGQRVDARSDIYSLGCGLFEVLTGRPPFNGHLVQAIIFSHQEAEPPRLADILGPAAVPEALEAVIAKMLRKKPVDRYQTMGELHDDLVRVRNGADLSIASLNVPGAKPVAPTHPGSRSKKVGWIGLIASTCALALGGFFFFGQKMHEPETKTARENQAPPAVAANHSAEANGSRDNKQAPDSNRQSGGGDSFSSVGQFFDKQGRPLRRFNFPESADLGYLAISGGASNKIEAAGLVDFPASAKLTYYPAGTFLQNSRYFPRFQKGDIDCLSLTNVMVPELQVATRIPGVRALTLESSAYIDDGCVGLIGKFEDLESLQIADCDLTGGGIAKLSTLLQLKRLSMTACEEACKLCKALEKSRRLTYLRLSSTGLTDQDYSSIASIASLEQLHLKGEGLTRQNLIELARLPKLTLLDITTTKVSPADIAVIARYPALARLRVAPMSKHDLSIFSDRLKGVSVESSNHSKDL